MSPECYIGHLDLASKPGFVLVIPCTSCACTWFSVVFDRLVLEVSGTSRDISSSPAAMGPTIAQCTYLHCALYWLVQILYVFELNTGSQQECYRTRKLWPRVTPAPIPAEPPAGSIDKACADKDSTLFPNRPRRRPNQHRREYNGLARRRKTWQCQS